MTRFLPFPIVSFCLLALWLLLNQAATLGHILLGCMVALVGGRILTVLELPSVLVRRPRVILRLLGLVAVDIVRSNLAVGQIVLGFGRRQRTAGFVKIPLDMRNPYGLASLACIITSTPGTLWVNFDAQKGSLMIHVLDLVDENEWIRTIKDRYERHLLEIFE
ncbi:MULTISPECIES: Na+/H+ antiporter subunit E [Bradyrhizobium]|uniref:Multicomponent K+:H+ antiporter subunit E n=1 Tax=Bradyrhizobium ottawaense TaxID=931866 RepID=A0A2U8NZQ0_9BRAD|nr:MULTISPECIES: Na+/H+ antiporter subunit E [Bradyrhizobium]AWL90904.1 Na+/H+ antiporter subunit E [Bradyrhizobium ottawaense]MBR1291821.1 Na+/H+ antiporter subunit E [Bradyrhizobium ottawaense]MBR1330140.1 Na+/H+ antiporter subunit E [Bradyrhizobium ottawaense]MBR1333228.1 Na+/H+ antiporter subunit E [Bradyrhizobium ottawaense]MDA9418741.1 monovalent cation/H+ antiporter subunit E [Bradyrhizobium sp. CCBAU 25360]